MEDLQNKFSIKGNDYKFATDGVPTESSDNFLSSGGMYDFYAEMQKYRNRSINNTSIVGGSTDLPTVGNVYEHIKAQAIISLDSGHLSSKLRHNIFYTTSYSTTPNSLSSFLGSNKGKTIYFSGNSTSQKLMYINDNGSSYYFEEPQAGIIYHNATSHKLCEWDGSTFANLTIS